MPNPNTLIFDKDVTLWGREPVLILGFVGAAISLAIAFGFNLTIEQSAALFTFTQFGVAFFARSQVTPVAKLPETPTTVIETPPYSNLT